MDTKNTGLKIREPQLNIKNDCEPKKFGYATELTHKMSYGLFGAHYAPHPKMSLADLESEGKRLVETINQSTSIIKIISDKNKIIGSNARYAIHGLKQQLDDLKIEISNLKNNEKENKDKYEFLSNNFNDLRHINEKLIRKSRQLEADNHDYATQNLALIDELDKTKKELAAANYWLNKVSNEINSKLVAITQSAEAGLANDEPPEQPE